MSAAWWRCGVLVVRHSVPRPPADHGFLTAGEHERVAAIRRSEDRDAFVARRWFVREVVAAATGSGPEVVSVQQRCARCGGPHGRPEVAVPGGPPLFASWSSVGGLVVVAVDRSPVGVDVAVGEDRGDWVRLEAVLKATGLGLDVDPSLVHLAGGRVRRWDGPGRRPRLRITDVPTVEGHSCAVAHRPGGGTRWSAPWRCDLDVGALVRRGP